MDSVVAIFDFLFGCHHQNLSRVFTIHGRTYRVCCKCGAEFKYSLRNMSMGKRFSRDPMLTCLCIAGDGRTHECARSC